MSMKKTTSKNIVSRIFVLVIIFFTSIYQYSSFSFLFLKLHSIFFQYGLKKKVPEEENMMMNNDDGGRVGRKKKTPAELAAEANADSDDDEFTSKFSSVCCCLNFF